MTCFRTPRLAHWIVTRAFTVAAAIVLAACANGPAGVVRTAAGSETLAPCPARPSCVVSRPDAGRHAIDALVYRDSAAAALARLSAILRAMPRTVVVLADDRYLHATQTSRLVRYTDDIEFLVDPERRRIDVRSCARTGYYDFGVNRARIEAIRELFD